MVNSISGSISGVNNIRGEISQTKEISGNIVVPERVGANDYNKLSNKPQIESIELVGDRPIKTWVDTLSVQEIEKILYLEG